MPHRPPLTALLLAALLSGCGTPGVALAPPRDPDPRCAALVARLPHDLGGLRAREVSPTSPVTRAWGSPAATLVCGALVPARFSDADSLTIDAIAWSSPDGSADPALWRTRSPSLPYLEVSLPRGALPATVLGAVVDAAAAG